MASIRNITNDTIINVDSCPVHDGIMWNCGNVRYFDPTKTLFEIPNTPIVPNTIAIKQAKLMLNNYGLLEKTEKIISEQPKYIQIVWDYASEFHRDNPILLDIASKLNLTSEQLDTMFIDASTL